MYACGLLFFIFHVIPSLLLVITSTTKVMFWSCWSVCLSVLHDSLPEVCLQSLTDCLILIMLILKVYIIYLNKYVNKK